MTETFVVCIGNSDDKLSQTEWAEYIDCVRALVAAYGKHVHFVGYTAPASKYQSATFVFEPYDGDEEQFLWRLGAAVRRYRQDSAAVVKGETEFITPRQEPPIVSVPRSSD